MTQWTEWDKKNHYASEILSNGTPVILLLYCHIILYREKVTSYEKFSHNLTLEVQIFLKNASFSMLSIEMVKIVGFPKVSFYEAQNSNHWNYSAPPPPPDKSFLRLFVRSYTVICRPLPSKCLNNAVLGRLEMV